MKITVIHERNARDCPADVREALGDRAVSYRTVARSVQEFRSGRVSTAAIQRSGPYVSVHTGIWVAVIEQRMHEERRWSVKELADETAISGSTVLRIFKTGLQNAQDCSQVGATSFKCGVTEDAIWDGQSGRISSRSGNMFNRIMAIDETSARAYEPELRRQSSKWRHTHEKGRFDKVCHPRSWWSFWRTTSTVFLCVIPFHRVRLWG
jgi:AraC-like DNA-binding protein